MQVQWQIKQACAWMKRPLASTNRPSGRAFRGVVQDDSLLISNAVCAEQSLKRKQHSNYYFWTKEQRELSFMLNFFTALGSNFSGDAT